MTGLEKKLNNGSIAMAEAVNSAKVDAVSAFPITPQTIIVEHLSYLKNNGKFQGEFIPVESEHSAPSFLAGTSLKGYRTFTASASQGVLLMSEVLYNVAGLRLPMVMGVSNRAVSAPLNIHNDQQDSISQRDSGWMQLYVPNNQMALDGILFSYKVAEDEKVMLPCMVCMDGFNLSHLIEPVSFPEQDLVDRFLPEFSPQHTLDTSKPKTFGYAVLQEHYMTTRRQLHEAMEGAIPIIEKTSREFEEIFGRKGPRLVDGYNTEKADIIMVSTGSIGELIREVIDSYSGDVKIGHMDLQFFRPFPMEKARQCLGEAGVIGVVDRNISLGHFGAVYSDLSSALQGMEKLMQNYILGLGGKNVGPDEVQYTINDLVRCFKEGKVSHRALWVGDEDPVEDKYVQPFADINERRQSIVLHGRGGQGAYTGAQLLAQILYKSGNSVHAFPSFGPEREGAPMRAYTRMNDSKEIIGDRSQIKNPNMVIVLDSSLVENIDVTEGLVDDGLVLVNYDGKASDLGMGNEYRVIALDASRIADTYLKGNFPNTPLVGAAAKLFSVKRESVEEAIRSNMPKKPEENVQAALHAYDKINVGR